jgi:hypothetical protein|tara:strand:+ start:1831 stop:2187 length:357 start_codon:yes stop_codon:yes gene_type:complete
MNDTKNILIQNVKEWVRIDNEMNTLKQELNKRKNEKKMLSNSLIEIMKENQIDCFDLKDGQLCFNTKTVKKPITKKSLFVILSKYYNGNDTKTNELQEFILNNRDTVTKESISRKILN